MVYPHDSPARKHDLGEYPLGHAAVIIRLLFHFSNKFPSDANLEARLDKMEEGDEFEPDELQGLVFSEDEEDLVGHEEKDEIGRAHV